MAAQPAISAHLAGLQQALSAERLGAYSSFPGESLAEVAARYLWNMALAEALYPALQWLEVTLRNAIHDAISAAPFTPTGAAVGEFWFREPSILTAPKSQRLVQQAEQEIAQRRRFVTSGRVVAELHFGFWVSLLTSGYAENAATAQVLAQAHAKGLAAPQYRLWPSLIGTAFPNFPSPNGNPRAGRSILWERFDQLRIFRNRVMHHEPIWRGRSDRARGYVPLPDVFNEIIEAVEWMNFAVGATLRDPLACRFLMVHGAGLGPYRAALAAYP